MTVEHILSVLSMYNQMILDDGHSLKCDNAAANERSRLSHCRWMCQQASGFTAPEDFGKLNRWLGFVQGVLWCYGFCTIAEMRSHNRSPQKG